MKKKTLLIAGASMVAAAGAVVVALKIKKKREEDNVKHLITLNDELDQPLEDMEQLVDEEPIYYHPVVDPLTRNEQIVREVKRMEAMDDDSPLKSDDELEGNDQEENCEDTNLKVVDDLLNVYTHLNATFIVKCIDECEKIAFDLSSKDMVSVNYSIEFESAESCTSFVNAMQEFGYACKVDGLMVNVKSVITLNYVKLLSDVLTISNQVFAFGGIWHGYEVR